MAKRDLSKSVKDIVAENTDAPVWIYSLLTDFDISLFVFKFYEQTKYLLCKGYQISFKFNEYIFLLNY